VKGPPRILAVKLIERNSIPQIWQLTVIICTCRLRSIRSSPPQWRQGARKPLKPTPIRNALRQPGQSTGWYSGGGDFRRRAFFFARAGLRGGGLCVGNEIWVAN